jgi:hypothetical protein
MNQNRGPALKTGEDIRDRARALMLRHGEHAEDYARARIEASETAGEGADAAEWRQVLDALSEGAGEN